MDNDDTIRVAKKIVERDYIGSKLTPSCTIATGIAENILSSTNPKLLEKEAIDYTIIIEHNQVFLVGLGKDGTVLFAVHMPAEGFQTERVSYTEDIARLTKGRNKARNIRILLTSFVIFWVIIALINVCYFTMM